MLGLAFDEVIIGSKFLYAYPQRKAIEHTGSDGEVLKFRLMIRLMSRALELTVGIGARFPKQTWSVHENLSPKGDKS